MKKLSKLMALLLSLLMIISLFAACGDDKDKDDDKKEETTASETNSSKEEKITGEALLLGKWDVYGTATGDLPFNIHMQATFNSDGTIVGYLSEADYDDWMEQLVELFIAQNGGGDNISAEDKESIMEMYKEANPYETMAAEYNDFGTWELDGDTLTIITESEDDEESEPIVIETELSKGVDSFEYSDEESTMTFEKAK